MFSDDERRAFLLDYRVQGGQFFDSGDALMGHGVLARHKQRMQELSGALRFFPVTPLSLRPHDIIYGPVRTYAERRRHKIAPMIERWFEMLRRHNLDGRRWAFLFEREPLLPSAYQHLFPFNWEADWVVDDDAELTYPMKTPCLVLISPRFERQFNTLDAVTSQLSLWREEAGFADADTASRLLPFSFAWPIVEAIVAETGTLLGPQSLPTGSHVYGRRLPIALHLRHEGICVAQAPGDFKGVPYGVLPFTVIALGE